MGNQSPQNYVSMLVPSPVTLRLDPKPPRRMSDDRIIEFMALMGDYMRNTDRRFEQLITVVHDGFGRLSDQITTLTDEVKGTNRRVDVLTERVDILTEEVKELKADVKELKADVKELKADVKVLKEEMVEVKNDVRIMKTEAQATNRRLNATFDHTGHLTEQVDATGLRISHVEQAQVPTNAELHQRVLALENKLNQAS